MIKPFFENILNWFRKIAGKGPKDTEKNTSPKMAATDRNKNAESLAGLEPGSEPRRRRPRRRKPSGRKPGKGQPDGARGVESSDENLPEAERGRASARPWDGSEFQVEPLEGKTRFHDLDLPIEIMHGIFDLGFKYCTPIQAEILPGTLKGADAAGRAQTGTGKTAVFLLTILNHMLRNPAPISRRRGTPRALILAPTRELAIQIEKDGKALGKYTRFKMVAVFGGMDYEKQKRLLTDQTVDIVVATPGRLLDFHRQGDIHLGRTEVMVIDEADRMLDMGFIPDVQRIIQSTPPKGKRQTMFFSATLTPEVTRFASQWTREPVTVEIEPEHVAVDTVDQIVYITTMEEKFPLLYNMITMQNLDRVIVFGNRRDQTRRLTEQFQDYGISCALLSGEVDQKKRIQVLENFRAGKIRVLVATDVAARGLHVDNVSHVINYNLPLDPEDYVHRIGRTGRAGASGISVSFASEDDSFQIPAIEKFLGRELRCIYPEDEWLKAPPPPEKRLHRPSPRPHPQSHPGRYRQGGTRKSRA